MARKRKAKSTEGTATRAAIDESALTKGEVRKLNALRTSVGEEIGTAAFTKWLAKRESKGGNEPTDKNAELIAEALMKLINEKKLRIPRGGYLVTRGRGRVIVEQPVYE